MFKSYEVSADEAVLSELEGIFYIDGEQRMVLKRYLGGKDVFTLH